jgi:hypothetical protein
VTQNVVLVRLKEEEYGYDVKEEQDGRKTTTARRKA